MQKMFIFLLIMATALGFYGCAQQERAGQEQVGTAESNKPPEPVQREIMDLGGNVVKVPSAEKLNRVVILSPPISSIQYSVLKDMSRIVAVHPLTFRNANPGIIQKVFTNLDQVDSGFIKGFNVNTEAVLNLNPDIVFYYGPQLKKGLENLKVPIVDFMNPKDRDPITVTSAWEGLIRDIFDVKNGKTIAEEWERLEADLAVSLKKAEGERLTGLMIFSNNSGKIMVSGDHTYGDYWLEMSGLINGADEIDGEKEVGMEQIYQWNPDIIYVFMGEKASNYLQGIEGQDWSRVKGVQEKRVYDVPKGIFAWAAPSADSPLMVRWMLTKNDPSSFSGDEFNNIVKAYYKEHYHITLTDAMLASILEPNRERE